MSENRPFSDEEAKQAFSVMVKRCLNASEFGSLIGELESLENTKQYIEESTDRTLPAPFTLKVQDCIERIRIDPDLRIALESDWESFWNLSANKRKQSLGARTRKRLKLLLQFLSAFQDYRVEGFLALLALMVMPFLPDEWGRSPNTATLAALGVWFITKLTLNWKVPLPTLTKLSIIGAFVAVLIPAIVATYKKDMPSGPSVHDARVPRVVLEKSDPKGAFGDISGRETTLNFRIVNLPPAARIKHATLWFTNDRRPYKNGSGQKWQKLPMIPGDLQKPDQSGTIFYSVRCLKNRWETGSYVAQFEAEGAPIDFYQFTVYNKYPSEMLREDTETSSGTEGYRDTGQVDQGSEGHPTVCVGNETNGSFEFKSSFSAPRPCSLFTSLSLSALSPDGGSAIWLDLPFRARLFAVREGNKLVFRLQQNGVQLTTTSGKVWQCSVEYKANNPLNLWFSYDMKDFRIYSKNNLAKPLVPPVRLSTPWLKRTVGDVRVTAVKCKVAVLNMVECTYNGQRDKQSVTPPAE